MHGRTAIKESYIDTKSANIRLEYLFRLFFLLKSPIKCKD